MCFGCAVKPPELQAWYPGPCSLERCIPYFLQMIWVRHDNMQQDAKPAAAIISLALLLLFQGQTAKPPSCARFQYGSGIFVAKSAHLYRIHESGGRDTSPPQSVMTHSLSPVESQMSSPAAMVAGTEPTITSPLKPQLLCPNVHVQEMLNGQKLQGVLTSDEVQEILEARGWELNFPLFTTINRIIHGEVPPDMILRC
eukprot:scaffold105046_cov17-Tisochrysis_lutea.AAC.2